MSSRVVLILASLTLCVGGWADESTVSGSSDTAVVLPSAIAVLRSPASGSSCYEYAVSELTRLLEGLGVESNVVAAADDAFGWRLELRPDGGALSPTSPGVPEGIVADGFLLDVSPRGVVLSATTPKGILNAVYELAERLGYLFLYPGPEGEWPPLNGRPMALQPGRALVNPRFPHRGIFNGSSSEEWASFYAKVRFNALCQPTDRELAERLGLRIEIGGHDLDTLLPRGRLEENPDIYRMDLPSDFFGKRVSDYNFCVASREAKRIIQENYREKLKELSAEGVYAWHAWPEDLPGGGWCQCPTCRSFVASDQAMQAMRILAEVVRDEELPMRVPMLVYHDTLFPGGKIQPPPESFLLYAPRTRCYGHALDDPSCCVNRTHLGALEEWVEQFAGIDDAHTFEYYLDRVLFRGLYPFLPRVILDDMGVYEEHGIESHICLQVGTSFVPILMMTNLLVFARGMWDAEMTADGFIEALASRILPEDPEPWIHYLSERAAVFAHVMRWEHEGHLWADYRWIPETTAPVGQEMATIYRKGSKNLAESAAALAEAVSPDWPERVRVLAVSEVKRSQFEAAEVRAMLYQQEAANHIGGYLSTASMDSLEQGVADLEQTVVQFDTALGKAREARIKEGDYYYMYNEWITKEIRDKLAHWRKVLNPAEGTGTEAREN